MCMLKIFVLIKPFQNLFTLFERPVYLGGGRRATALVSVDSQMLQWLGAGLV